MQFRGHTGTVTALLVSEDGAVLYSASADATIRSWSTDTAAARARAARVCVHSLIAYRAAD